MTETVLVALLSLCGTLIGSLGGILVANKLVNYRLQQLENKVEAHNKVVERTFKLEGQMEEVQHDIKDLKAYHKPS
jgi:Na+/glutamate symporter